MIKRMICLLLVPVMLAALLPTAVFAAEDGMPTVYVSISDDFTFVESNGSDSGTIMAYVPVNLTEVAERIDLADYGLQDYAYDADGDDVPELTLLHVFLYVLNEYYAGTADELYITGSSGSMYMQKGFWGHDENLTYYVNGEYPLERFNWGATADHIVMHDGDFINVSMYTDWGFYADPKAGYHFFYQGQPANDRIVFDMQASVGEPLDLWLGRAWGDFMAEVIATANVPEPDYPVYLGQELYGAVQKELVTGADGHLSLTFSKPGTYWLWADGASGDTTENAVSAPGALKITVAGTEDLSAAAEEVMALIRAIGAVTMDSQPAIAKARAAYDALSSEAKALVTNLDVLLAAEEQYAHLVRCANGEHSFGDYKLISMATCTEEGSIQRACVYCGLSETIVMAPYGHKLGEATVSKEATCVEAGERTAVCTVCGSAITEVIPALGHDYAVVGVAEATCTGEGYTGDVVCTVCGDVLHKGSAVAALAHQWSNWALTVEAECGKDGIETRTCANCGETETRTFHKNCVCDVFTDVELDAWYHEAVEFVYANQIMSGVKDDVFAPENSLTRAQMVTILYRMAGSPEYEAVENIFTDVKEKHWFYNEVMWAVSTGLTNGTSADQFSPNREMTRSQLVTFLARFAKADVGAVEYDLSVFEDASAVKSYAVQNLKWALANGLLHCDSEAVLNPNGAATRAEAAFAMMVFLTAE